MSTTDPRTTTARGPGVSAFVSLSRRRYGHDPAHYPIKAIKYVMSNAALWPIVFKVARIGCILAAVSLGLLFVFALAPQAKAIGGGEYAWWSWLLAIFVVFLEGAIVVAALLVMVQSRAQAEVFVATMKLKGRWRESDMKAQSTLADLNVFKRAFFARVLTLPLMIIPFVGGAIYSAINATFTGWDYMDRYFDAIKLSSKMQRLEVLGEDFPEFASLFRPSTYDSDNDYARFGFVAGFLESIPFVGPTVFPITNAVAAALFACDIESKGGPSCLQKDS